MKIFYFYNKSKDERGKERATLRGKELATLRGKELTTLRGKELATLRGKELATLRGKELATLRGKELATLHGKELATLPHLTQNICISTMQTPNVCNQICEQPLPYNNTPQFNKCVNQTRHNLLESHFITQAHVRHHYFLTTYLYT